MHPHSSKSSEMPESNNKTENDTYFHFDILSCDFSVSIPSTQNLRFLTGSQQRRPLLRYRLRIYGALTQNRPYGTEQQRYNFSIM